MQKSMMKKDDDMKLLYYFDSAATTKPLKEVVDAANKYIRDWWGNPSSLYEQGNKAKRAIEFAREQVALAINAIEGNVYFTPSASMTNSLLLKTLCQQRWTKEWGCHIITTSIEHSSILNTCKFLEKNGVNVTYLRVDSNGLIDLDELKNSIKSNTVLISVIGASNEIGTIQLIKEIVEIGHSFGIPVHIDATQMLGRISIDVEDWGVDFLTGSAHKVHGLRGAAMLYYADDIVDYLNPLVNGGPQESGLIAGTENTPAIVAFGKAMDIAETNRYDNRHRTRTQVLYLWDKLSGIPGTHINGVDVTGNDATSKRLVNNLNIRFDGVDAQKLQSLLAEKNICVSVGSACNAGNREASRVLKAIGLTDEQALSSIRITLDIENTIDQCDYLVRWLQFYVPMLRKI